MNILITGAGGPLGQSIIKAARMSSLVSEIIATDTHPMSVGLYSADHGYLLPSATRETDSYLASLKRICQKHDAKAILIGSEPEIRVLSGYRGLFQSIGTVVITSDNRLVETALDKLSTCEFLESNGLNHPQYASAGDPVGIQRLIGQVGFPLIIKPRRGSGSQGIFRAYDSNRLGVLLQLYNDEAVVQELLLPDDQEYTVGVFIKNDGSPHDSIILHRELAAGLTYRASVVKNKDIEEEAARVALAFGALGPCNIQLRLTERGPVTFEINPRFSSTTSVRAHFGYNEVDMALRNLVMHHELEQSRIRSGFMMRYWEENYQNELRDFSSDVTV